MPIAGEGMESDVVTCVLLVEDHTTVREAMAGAFEREPDLHVTGQAGTLAEAREMLAASTSSYSTSACPTGSGPT